jgi:hypothetical protein
MALVVQNRLDPRRTMRYDTVSLSAGVMTNGFPLFQTEAMELWKPLISDIERRWREVAAQNHVDLAPDPQNLRGISPDLIQVRCTFYPPLDTRLTFHPDFRDWTHSRCT